MATGDGLSPGAGLSAGSAQAAAPSAVGAATRSPGQPPGVPDIDWSAPWLAGWRGLGEPVAARIAAGVLQPQALNEAGLAPVRFVPQAQLPEGQAYEDYIFATGQVPTREGLHDFFNALCWMHFPLAKQRLNQLQAREIARAGVRQVRGPVRDAATVFDENAWLIQPSDAMWAALTGHRWVEALVHLRAEWAHTRLWAFGHAVLEKAVQPYKSITAHLWRVPPQVPPEQIDAWLAGDLTADKLSGKPFSPLPILGVPGWWPPNEDPDFYKDSGVFRPRRAKVPPEKPYAKPEISPAA